MSANEVKGKAAAPSYWRKVGHSRREADRASLETTTKQKDGTVTIKVDANGRRYELAQHQVMALKALIVGYERIDRVDGMFLTMLGLAYRSAYGFKVTREGMQAAIEERHDDDGGADGEEASEQDRGA